MSSRQVFNGRPTSLTTARNSNTGSVAAVGAPSSLQTMENMKNLAPFMQIMRGGGTLPCSSNDDGTSCDNIFVSDPGYFFGDQQTVLRIGISHKDAAVGLREKLATAEKSLNHLSDALCTTGTGTEVSSSSTSKGNGRLKISEALVLSTCNRFELFLVTNSPEAAAEHVFRTLSDRTKTASPTDPSKHVEVDTLRSTMRVIVGAQATSEHLFRLTAGLDSIVLGEPQVLGQVRTALEIAKDKASGGRAGAVLKTLFNSAIKTTGRVRAETALSRGSMSVSSTAVGFSMGRLLSDTGIPAIAKARVVVVGNGKMARLLFQNLQLHGVKDVTVVCRTEAKVKEIQKEVTGSTLHFVPMSGLASAIASADIVFPCTSAPEPIITPSMLLDSLSVSKRVINPYLAGGATTTVATSSCTDCVPSSSSASHHNKKPHKAAMQIIDISVPRNVHNDVNGAAFATALKKQTGQSVSSYNVDDLKSLMTQNALMRQNEVKEAESIIETEVSKYLNMLYKDKEKEQGQGHRKGRKGGKGSSDISVRKGSKVRR